MRTSTARGHFVTTVLATLVLLAGCTTVLGIDGDVERTGGESGSGATSATAGSQAATTDSTSTTAGPSTGSGGLLPDGSECFEHSDCQSGCCTGTCEPAGSCTSSGCDSANDCPPSSECKTWFCDVTCMYSYVALGTVISMQTDGDCLQNQCDGNGGVHAVEFDDAPADPNPDDCSYPRCMAGMVVTTNHANGLVCMQDSSRICCDGVCCGSGQACTNGMCI